MINLPVIDDDKSQLPIHQNPTYQYGAIGIVVILVLLGFYLWKWSYKKSMISKLWTFCLEFFWKKFEFFFRLQAVSPVKTAKKVNFICFIAL